MESYLLCCAGQFVPSERELIIRSPFSGEEIGRTFLASRNQLEEAIKEGKNAEKSMKVLPPWKRAEILNLTAKKLEEQFETFARLVSAEAAKPLKLARTETLRAIEVFKIAAEECKRIPGEYLDLESNPYAKNKEAWLKYFPIGLIAGISPFNFPLNLAVHKVAPAIAAGCPIILKPASSTPLSMLRLARLLIESGLPEGALSVMPCNREDGQLLVTHPDIKLLSFTGSPEVGWELKNLAGKKKVILELGGNAAAVITPTANLKEAARLCAGGGFAYAGQICIHTQRIYVHENIAESFINLFLDEVKKISCTDPSDEHSILSCMIDRKNADRIRQWVKESLNDGSILLHESPSTDNRMGPVVLTNTKPHHQIVNNESFGPVVILEKYSELSEAINRINLSPFGLQAGVFTDSISEMDQAFEEIDCGAVLINEVPTFRADQMPYGGIKDSGLGREGIKYAILEMSEPKLLVKPKKS